MPDERTPDIRDRLPNDVGPDFSAANAPVEIPPLPVDAPEEANEIYTRLIEAEKPSLEEAISLLHHSEAQDEILAVPEIREAALRAYGKAMTQIRSMDDLEFCGSLQTAFLIEEHPEELEAERIAGYLDSIRTGDLELILRSEVLLLGGVEIPIEPLHAAIEEAYLAALRREEPVGEGSPIETLSRFFQYSVDPERLAEITASERIGGELSKQIEEALLEGRIRKLRQLSDDSSLAMDPREDPTFEDMRVQGLIQVLSRGQSDLAKEILRTWALPDDVQIRPEVRSAASSVFNMPNATVAEMVGMTELFPTLVKGTSESESSRMVLDALKQAGLGASQNSHFADWERLSPLFISVPELQGDPELQAAAVEIEVKPLLMKGKRDQAKSISDKWEFSLQAVLDGLSPEERSKAFVATVAHGSLFEARELREALQVNSEDLQGETIAAALKGRIATEFESSIVSAREWIDAFPELAESLLEIAVNAFSNALLSSRVQRAVDLLELPELQVPGLRPSGVLGTVFANQEFSSLDEMRKFAEEEPSYLRTLAQMTNPPLLSRKDLEQVKKLGISAVDGELARQSDVALDAMNNDSDYQRLYDAIRGSAEWDNRVVQIGFEAGAQYFGYQTMFRFVDRPDISRERAVRGFDGIVRFAQQVELDPKEFAQNILEQVRNDRTAYREGTAFDRLRTIAGTSPATMMAIVDSARTMELGGELGELLQSFTSPAVIASSWGSLKRFVEIQNIIGDPSLLGRIESLQRAGKDKHYQFVQKLAFHRDSRISPNAVMKLVQNPEDFLAQDDYEANSAVHRAKKPSNYLHFPHLDLTAKDAVDALIEGSLDRVQVFTPLEVGYTVYERNGQVFSTVREMTSVALGSRRQKIQGAARNVKALFVSIQEELKSLGVSVPDYIAGQEIPAECEERIRDRILDRENGMTVSEMRLVARINPKSDPTGIIAGDDTACCMPFGSGKNTVYTFNLNTGQFTLQLEREGNRPRTIAQSVLTKDRDSGKSVPELVSQILYGHKHITEVLGPEIMQEGTAVAACDNVEVAPNYMESRYLDAIKIIYTDFFRKYMARYGTEQNLETEKVVVGLGYSDALQNLKREPNTYVPLAPVSYSDKLGEMVGKLDLTTDTSAVRCDVREIMVGEARKNPAIDVCGVSYLTYEDTHSVSWLEGKAYQDNPGFIENFHNMENGLIAKDIANEHFDRPNMSLKYSQEGRVFGYLMAWEGKMNSSHSGEPVVYIADLAVEPGNRMAGGRLVHAFGDLYKENYIKNGHLPAIVGEFREDTSYKLVKKHLQKLTQRLGVEFEITELGTEQRNGERMHRLVIRPKAA